MTEKQRYRPLAVGERIEYGDQFRTCLGWWTTTQPGDLVPESDVMEYRRPIPETDWRDPVGGAGYPYPPGTVVEEEAYPLWLFSAAHKDSIAVRVYRYKDGSYQVNNSIWLEKDCNRTIRHRVIDYRPDLVNQQNNVGSEGMGIRGEEGQPETDPRDQSNEPCCSCQAELTRLRAEVERYAAENERLRFKIGKSKTIDLTESTVFVGAAWGVETGEIQ